MKFVPLHNNVKNQRNLSRQTRYGCSYFSMAHLLPIQLTFNRISKTDDAELEGQLKVLNDITKQVAGFTFCAKALKSGNYQVAVHLYKPQTQLKEYLCLALVSLDNVKEEFDEPRLTIWVPQANHEEVLKNLDYIASKVEGGKLTLVKTYPRDWTRVRLIGPEAREKALKIAVEPELQRKAAEEVDLRLSHSLGLSIGRHVKEAHATFVYYKTNPQILDIIFEHREGRMLWYKLIKNKAHLVGGYRDLGRILDDRFQVKPDCPSSSK